MIISSRALQSCISRCILEQKFELGMIVKENLCPFFKTSAQKGLDQLGTHFTKL